MRILIATLSIALFLSATSVTRGDFIVLDQIDTFVPVTFNSVTTALSLNDSSADPNSPNFQRSDFAVTYESFSHTSSGTTTKFSWVGSRQEIGLPDPGSNFTIRVYGDALNAPPVYGTAELASFSVTGATTTDLGNDYNLYEANASFAFSAGTKYWVSIVNELDYNTNGWGLAFSDRGGGDMNSFQDYEPDIQITPTRYNDAIDYAIRITAVPEPSSALACLVGLGLVTFRRRRA